MDKEKLNRLLETIGNVSILIVYSYFLYTFIIDFLYTHRISSAIMIVFESLCLGFVLVRAMPKKRSMSFKDWFVAMAGTFLPLLFRPDTAGINDAFILQIFQMTGMGVSVFGLLMLNKSFGIVAANRGVKKGGIYQFIRHPIYAGYFISYTMYVAQNATLQNMAVLIGFMLFTFLRIFAEERFLSQDPEYAEFMTKTKWRILPFIF
jgi:protein-S-isoprenylcysteine O-methyltransferase Ste14